MTKGPKSRDNFRLPAVICKKCGRLGRHKCKMRKEKMGAWGKKRNKGYYLYCMPGPFLAKDTLNVRQTAFYELLKRTAVECSACHGTGLFNIAGIVYMEHPCHRCQGEAEVCGLCFHSVFTCDCGAK